MTARRFGIAAGLTPRAARKWIAAAVDNAPVPLYFSIRCFTFPALGGATFAPARVADAILKNAECAPRDRWNVTAWRK